MPPKKIYKRKIFKRAPARRPYKTRLTRTRAPKRIRRRYRPATRYAPHKSRMAKSRIPAVIWNKNVANNPYKTMTFQQDIVPSNTNVKYPCVYTYGGKDSSLPMATNDIGTQILIATRVMAYYTQNFTATFVQSNPITVIKNCRILYDIVNQSNGPMLITVYWCMWRKDIQFSSSLNNPLHILGQGFAINNVDPTNPSAVNSGVTDHLLTPFNSPKFCQLVKVLKSKSLRLNSGRRKQYMLVHKKPMRSQASEYVEMGNGQDINTGTRSTGSRGGSRWLLFKVSGCVTNDFTTTTANCISAPKIVMSTIYTCDYQYTNINKGTIQFAAPTGLSAAAVGPAIREIGDQDDVKETNA